MKTHTEFAVVIPMFNSINHIERAIGSIIQQSLKASEIIVVDDGSQDGCADLVRENFKGVTVITQNNRGAGAARNAGIKTASYDWIAFLDSDDFWLPNHLEVASRVIQSYPKTSFVSTKIQNWNATTPLEIRQVQTNDSVLSYFREQTLNPGVVTSSSVIVKREAFNTVGEFKTIEIGEDLDMWERLALNFEFAHSNEVTAVYVQNRTGAMAKFGSEISLNPQQNQQKLYISQNLAGTFSSILKKDLQRYENRLTLTNVKSLLLLDQIELGKNMAAEISGSALLSHRLTLWVISRSPKFLLRFLVNKKKKSKHAVDENHGQT